jgi:uncharacterized repeat protein (TIGR03803 family)
LEKLCVFFPRISHCSTAATGYGKRALNSWGTVMIELNHSRSLALLRRASCLHVFRFLPVVLATLGSMLAGQVRAQTYSVSSFSGNNEGWPNGLIQSSETFYGTAEDRIGFDGGMVFKFNSDGTDFTTLHTFSRVSGGPDPVPYTNSDGAYPSGLIVFNNRLYGSTEGGGSSGNGTLFSLDTDGTGFSKLHSFTATRTNSSGFSTNSDGAFPSAGLLLSGNTLYGMASGGGTSGHGTVFTVNTDGTAFRVLHSFTEFISYTNSDGGIIYSNSDGAFPSTLIVSSNSLYGTTWSGGGSGGGTVFKVNTDGTGFTNLHSFTAGNTNLDGAHPAGLVLSGTILYGTAQYGGTAGNGTVFSVKTDVSGFTILHSFTAQIPSFINSFGDMVYTNGDGAGPTAGLVLSANTLYGTTSSGGRGAGGTVFSVKTDGTDFTILHSFGYYGGAPQAGVVSEDDGANPQAGVILVGNTLYGTTKFGGAGADGAGAGTLFSISLSPQLTATLTPSGTNVLLSWPTGYAGFDYSGYTLESTTDLGSPNWTTNPQAPVAVNGLKSVSVPAKGTRQFFRLRQ